MGIAHGNMALYNYMEEQQPMHQQLAMTPYRANQIHSYLIGSLFYLTQVE